MDSELRIKKRNILLNSLEVIIKESIYYREQAANFASYNPVPIGNIENTECKTKIL
jgi:hypothetical protein